MSNRLDSRELAAVIIGAVAIICFAVIAITGIIYSK